MVTTIMVTPISHKPTFRLPVLRLEDSNQQLYRIVRFQVRDLENIDIPPQMKILHDMVAPILMYFLTFTYQKHGFGHKMYAA